MEGSVARTNALLASITGRAAALVEARRVVNAGERMCVRRRARRKRGRAAQLKGARREARKENRVAAVAEDVDEAAAGHVGGGVECGGQRGTADLKGGLHFFAGTGAAVAR